MFEGPSLLPPPPPPPPFPRRPTLGPPNPRPRRRRPSGRYVLAVDRGLRPGCRRQPLTCPPPCPPRPRRAPPSPPACAARARPWSLCTRRTRRARAWSTRTGRSPWLDYAQETGSATVDIITPGSRRRHPGCLVALSHAGGTLPALLWHAAILRPRTPKNVGGRRTRSSRRRPTCTTTRRHRRAG